jgi:LEA14-like dessication related protein
LKVGIENPTDSQFLIKGIAGNVSANGNVIGNVTNYSQANINPRSTTYYYLPVRLSIIGVATDIYNTLTGNGSLSQEIVFNGAANVDGYDVPD